MRRRKRRELIHDPIALIQLAVFAGAIVYSAVTYDAGATPAVDIPGDGLPVAWMWAFLAVGVLVLRWGRGRWAFYGVALLMIPLWVVVRTLVLTFGGAV